MPKTQAQTDSPTRTITQARERLEAATQPDPVTALIAALGEASQVGKGFTWYEHDNAACDAEGCPVSVALRQAEDHRAMLDSDERRAALDLAEAAREVMWFQNPDGAPPEWREDPTYGLQSQGIDALAEALAAYLSALDPEQGS